MYAIAECIPIHALRCLQVQKGRGVRPAAVSVALRDASVWRSATIVSPPTTTSGIFGGKLGAILEILSQYLVSDSSTTIYTIDARFRRFRPSGNHWLIWLIGVASRFVRS